MSLDNPTLNLAILIEFFKVLNKKSICSHYTVNIPYCTFNDACLSRLVQSVWIQNHYVFCLISILCYPSRAALRSQSRASLQTLSFAERLQIPSHRNGTKYTALTVTVWDLAEYTPMRRWTGNVRIQPWGSAMLTLIWQRNTFRDHSFDSMAILRQTVRLCSASYRLNMSTNGEHKYQIIFVMIFLFGEGSFTQYKVILYKQRWQTLVFTVSLSTNPGSLVHILKQITYALKRRP